MPINGNDNRYFDYLFSHSEYHVLVSSNFRGQAGQVFIPDLSAKSTALDDTPVFNI